MSVDIHTGDLGVTTKEYELGNQFIRMFNPHGLSAKLLKFHRLVFNGIFIPLSHKTQTVNHMPSYFTPEVIVRNNKDGKITNEVVSFILITDSDQTIIGPYNYRLRTFNGRSQVSKVNVGDCKYGVPRNVHTIIQVNTLFTIAEPGKEITLHIDESTRAHEIETIIYTRDARLLNT